MAETKLNELTITVRQAQLLLQLLEQNAKGYDRPQLRKLDRIADMIESEVNGFTQSHRELLEDTQAKLVLAVESERPGLQRKYDQAAKELNESDGAKELKFLFDNSERDFLRNTWAKGDSYRGVKDVRKSILAIDDAMDGIEAVKVKASKEEQAES